MSSPEEFISPVHIETSDRIVLANSALEVVRQFGRTAEVLIGLQRLLKDSENADLNGIDAMSVPYDTFKDMGRMIQNLLHDEMDRRVVKLRSDRVYRVVDDPDYYRVKRSAGRSSHLSYVPKNSQV
jgi:hypothetical protein